MLSVALCTYNGARYIREQLESILNQTMKVDEIVVCDDGSTDDTLSIIEALAVNSEVAISICRNTTTLGVCGNFQKAVDLCKGDIIFLADQDDVWHPDKVAVMVDYLEQYPDKQVVFTDADLIDEKGGRVGDKSLWDYVGMTAKAQSYIEDGFGIELFAGANRATGATMVIRRSFTFLHSFEKYTNDIILHDYTIALLALINRQLGFVREHTIDYRIHFNQQFGIRDYFTAPMDDSVCHTNHDTVVIESLGFPEPVASRIAFVIKRDRNRHKALGVFRILSSSGQYKSVYGDAGCGIAREDFRQWMSNQRHRLFSTKK